ncbi:restriction endonuclease subunit S [Clostridium perfringens]|uniref:restriction endonuclease subunit S n=1 Tax=Clostridium perfringens TaxID=1502 RepID=UPI00240E760B|nr:restriction endonuclease subunit S [Clostridium perfringens]MDK0624326.1 restriction endonuclease subunit S [Clostridium perfringens]MDK0844111.1 restriction endonuclease subunit S [Clostridium perfringens]MDM0888307.1 restriction endonuclease subunit S [Clostridium perfringens]WFD87362.1 restriction endonuclease subunit S [Clostridium perfringens]
MKKEVREGYKMTELGEIPNEWEVCRIDDLCKVNSKSLNSKTEPNLVVNYIDIESVSTGKINNIKQMIFSQAPSRARRVVKKNDVIMSTVRPYLKAFVKVKSSLNNLVCSTGFAVLEVNEGVNSEFVYQSILSNYFIEQIKNKMVGSNYPAVNSDDVKESKLILPSIQEQEKIAEILSTVDEQIENTEKLIQKNQELKKGLMQQLLTKGIGHTEFKKTEIGSVPIEWEIKNLEYLVEIRNGNSPSNFTLNETGKYPFFKVDDMNYTNKYLNKAKVYFDDCKYSLMIKGMIVFPKRGASIFTNKIAILNLNGYFDTNIMGLKCKDELINEYLFYYLKFIGLERFADTTAVPQINNKHINPLKIPIPSIIEQEKIVWGLDQIDGKIEQYKNKKEKLEYLKCGLMQDLLLGKIRVI